MKIPLKENWMWLIYSILLGSLVIYRTVNFLNPQCLQFTYYTTFTGMCTSRNIFPSPYVFAAASLPLNAFLSIFIIFYAFRRFTFSIEFILLLLAAKLPTDLLGYSFEWVSIKAIYHHSPALAWNQGLTLFFWILPSYIALMDYTVRYRKTRMMD